MVGNKQGCTMQLHVSFLIAAALMRKGKELTRAHSCHLPTHEHLCEVWGELALPGEVLCEPPRPGGSGTKAPAQTCSLTLSSCVSAGVASAGTLRTEKLQPAPLCLLDLLCMSVNLKGLGGRRRKVKDPRIQVKGANRSPRC